MASRYVREVGYVECMEGTRIHVGVDHDAIRIRGDGLLESAQQETFAQLLLAAVWQAGQNKGHMDEEVP